MGCISALSQCTKPWVRAPRSAGGGISSSARCHWPRWGLQGLEGPAREGRSEPRLRYVYPGHRTKLGEEGVHKAALCRSRAHERRGQVSPVQRPVIPCTGRLFAAYTNDMEPRLFPLRGRSCKCGEEKGRISCLVLPGLGWVSGNRGFLYTQVQEYSRQCSMSALYTHILCLPSSSETRGAMVVPVPGSRSQNTALKRPGLTGEMADLRSGLGKVQSFRK